MWFDRDGGRESEVVCGLPIHRPDKSSSMFPFDQIWTGPACIVGGLTLLGLQVHAYLQLELISARLLG